jgi:hypothetical protein
MKKGIVTLLVIAVALLLIGLSVQPTLAGSDTAAQGKMAAEKAGPEDQHQYGRHGDPVHAERDWPGTGRTHCRLPQQKRQF